MLDENTPPPDLLSLRMQVSFLELYNEELTDLLSFDDDSKKLRWEGASLRMPLRQ